MCNIVSFLYYRNSTFGLAKDQLITANKISDHLNAGPFKFRRNVQKRFPTGPEIYCILFTAGRDSSRLNKTGQDWSGLVWIGQDRTNMVRVGQE